MSDTQTETVAEPAADGAGDPALETRARAMGWRPQDEYKGRQPWVSAAEFVDNGERIIPLMNERNRALTDNVAKLTKEIEDQRTTVAQMVAMARRAEKVGYAKAVRDLEAKRDSAIRDGDVDTVRAVDREIRDLGPEPIEPPAPAAPRADQPDPVVAAWVRQNPWFRNDKPANAYAVGMLDTVKEENPDFSLEEQLAEVAKRVKADLPRLTPRRQAEPEDEAEPPPRRERGAAMVSSSTHGDRRPTVKPRSFEALPRDVQAQFERAKRMCSGKGEPLTKEEYASYYKWDEEAA